MQIGKYRLEGGGSCPEQYDVFDGEKEVGYLRLRHGIFRADWTEGEPVTVYKACPVGDGAFASEEREKYLTAAVQAIDAARCLSVAASAMAGTFVIPVVTRLQDNDNRSCTMYVYNNNEEMLQDHPLAREAPLTAGVIDKILNENDPHKNGYMGKSTISIQVVNGVARLAKSPSFHAGQPT
jgi:hypothetical protein